MRTKNEVNSGNAAKHTLFLFNDKSVHRVLDAYGQLLVETFSDRELREGVFTAVGQVHRVPEVECAKHYPHHVGHYWPEYMPELNSRDPKPKTFVQCLLAALAASHLHGESFAAVDHIAAGVLHLAGLPGNLTSGRRHAAVCGALRANNEALRAYRRLIAIFAIRREAITAEAWRDEWRGIVSLIVTAIPGSKFLEADAETHPFMAWNPMSELLPKQTGVVHRGNYYGHPPAAPKVQIRAGSIHSVKGETHTATLVLETYWYKHLRGTPKTGQ